MKQKAKLVTVAVGATSLVALTAFFLLRTQRDIADDCLTFAKAWSENGAAPDVKLVCGSKALSPDASKRAFSLLKKISGPFEIVRHEESPRFADTQGVFVHVRAGGAEHSFGIQGFESGDKTAIEFERMLGQACALREAKQVQGGRARWDYAMSKHLPQFLDELKALGASGININSYGYATWEDVIEHVRSRAEAGGPQPGL